MVRKNKQDASLIKCWITILGSYNQVNLNVSHEICYKLVEQGDEDSL